MNSYVVALLLLGCVVHFTQKLIDELVERGLRLKMRQNNQSEALRMSYEVLDDVQPGAEPGRVYLELVLPTELVSTIEAARHHVRNLPRPILTRVVSLPGNSVELLLCQNPKIIAFFAVHRIGQGRSELTHILRVLRENQYEVLDPPEDDLDRL